jgi:hypothetical protein
MCHGVVHQRAYAEDIHGAKTQEGKGIILITDCLASMVECLTLQVELLYAVPIIKGQTFVTRRRVIEFAEMVFFQGHILGLNIPVNGAKIIKIFE